MSFPISLIGVSTAGGVIMGPGNPKYRVNGIPVSVIGDQVAGHAPGIHQGAVMVTGSLFYKVNGIPVVRETSAASCGHTADGIPNYRIP